MYYHEKTILTIMCVGIILSSSPISQVSAYSVDSPTVSTKESVRAISYPPEGGMWDYGVNFTHIWSNYYHEFREHKSSVDGLYYFSSQWERASHLAKADAIKSFIGGNKSYYNVR